VAGWVATWPKCPHSLAETASSAAAALALPPSLPARCLSSRDWFLALNAPVDEHAGKGGVHAEPRVAVAQPAGPPQRYGLSVVQNQNTSVWAENAQDVVARAEHLLQGTEWDRKVSGERQRQVPEVTPRKKTQTQKTQRGAGRPRRAKGRRPAARRAAPPPRAGTEPETLPEQGA
jgi:hypothetical protein